MLIEFSVSNFRSIRERQTLSLVASTGGELRKTNVFDPQAPATPELLRSVVIYGANAAGKSNLFAALQYFVEFVLLSSLRQPEESTRVVPFAMDDASRNLPSEFEAIFVQDGVRYQYGFSATAERVESEWLNAYPEGRTQRWFDRGPEKWRFGAHLRGAKKTWQEATRPNALFLSTAVQLNAEQLLAPFQWFSTRLHMIRAGVTITRDLTIAHCDRSDGHRRAVVDFLRVADLGISDMHIQEGPDASGRTVIPKSVRDVHFSHVGVEGSRTTLKLEDESGGTRKLFGLAGPWLDILDAGSLLLVDELDTSLHPVLMRHLVRLFLRPDTNPKGAQLVFSTHDTSILDRSVFRRDQVWFVEKDRTQATRLYPLTDFSPRKEESLERGYLQGRYGALPFVGELRV